MKRVRAKAPGGPARVPVLLVDQEGSGAVPDRRAPTRFDDVTSALPAFRPSPIPFRSVGLDRQTKSEPRQEIHRRMRNLYWFPGDRRTSQRLAPQNDNVQQPFGRANG